MPEHCLRKVDLATTVKDQSFYKNTGEFYKSIATQTSLKANYESHFTLGFSLDATTKTVSGSKREISGTSLNLATKSYELQFLPNCLYETTVHDRVIADFSRLDVEISEPWYKVSWRDYHHFLQTHGSHVVTAVTLGSSVDQYAFAEESSSYSSRDFTVKACASLAGNVAVSSLSVEACSGVTKEEISKLYNSKMTTTITVRGGTVDTRNRLVYERSNELLIQFLGEGQTQPTPIEYTLTPIWQILRSQKHVVAANKNTRVQAINLQYYYDGYLNFGCPLVVGKRGPELQMFNHARHHTASDPVFQCSLAPSGCHSNEDCHCRGCDKCRCHGDSCIVYREVKQGNGARRLTAVPNYSSDVKENGCDRKFWGVKCSCENENTQRRIIF